MPDQRGIHRHIGNTSAHNRRELSGRDGSAVRVRALRRKVGANQDEGGQESDDLEVSTTLRFLAKGRGGPPPSTKL
jgi:hypothetical protein